MKIKTYFLILLSLICSTALSAQSNDSDFMSNIGKIYVVVAVIAAVFIGITLFLLYLDRKITKLENQINEHD